MAIMACPTQDMDVSSSFTTNDNLPNNNSSIGFCKKEIMDERDEVDLVWINTSPINVSKKYENPKHLDNHSIVTKSCESTFPWLNKFNKIMCSSVGHRSYQLLKRLLSLYTQNILSSINTYCEKALDVIKLKNHLSNTLTFFHMYWCDIKEHVSDCNAYFNEMSVLLEIYIDMELKTFKHTMDSSKLASKLLSALWIYLSDSKKHIFRVLLKLKLVTTKYSKICDPIFMRSFITLQKSVESLTDIDYVRYLLVLKVWKRLRENVEEKKEVNRMALTILGPCIPKMRNELLNIIPKPPTGHENETNWLLQPNIFDLKSACKNFITLEETMFSEFKDMCLMKTTDLDFQFSQSSLYDDQRNVINVNGNVKNSSFENETKNDAVNNQLFAIKKRYKFKEAKKVSKLKPGEVILIDLTEEDKLRIDKQKKRKESKRSLEWLKMMKKKYKVQKQTGEIKCKNQVEIADAHSTENSENVPNKILLEDLPISDNKVSESTESYTSIEQKSIQDGTCYNSQNIPNNIFSKRSNELKCMLQPKQCDTCSSSLKQTNVQYNKVSYFLKLLSALGQNIKDPKAILNLLRESREKDVMSSQDTFFCGNTASESGEINTQGKEGSFPQQNNSIGSLFSSKECQNDITNIQSIKQELPTNADYSTMEGDTFCQNDSVYVQSDCHSHDFRSMNSHSLQVIETIKQKLCRDAHECTGCCKKIEMKPFSYHNNSMFNTTIKNEDMPQNAIDNGTDKKSICDKNVMCMLSDLDKCMDVLNRIGEHIMTVHAEKQRFECLDKTDVCAVSTTVSGDQSTELSSDWIQNINSLTNTEKLSRILELYGKKDLLNTCNCQDFHRWDKQEISAVLKQLKGGSDNCQKVTVSTSQTNGKDNVIFSDEPSSFICSYIKSEFEQPIKKQNDECFEILRDKTSQCQINMLTHNEIDDAESFVNDLKGTKELNRDTNWESTLQKTNLSKSHSVDEFGNIDILDSILNGDITIEDEQHIWEDSQSPLMSPINYDNSNSVLNCITEFFSQSEHTYETNEIEEKYILSDTENSQSALPEGSLGTTGILNSLLDFDLTNMDSPSNDFMYPNIQVVNPRLIKKTFEDEIYLLKNSDTSELHSPLAVEKDDSKDTVLEKEKKLCNNENDSTNNSVDVVGFGLNTIKEKALQYPSPVKNMSLFCDQSAVSGNSDNISSEEKESFSKCSLSSPFDKFDTGSFIEKSYIFQKRNAINQVRSLNDTISRDLPESCTSNDISSNTSMNCVLSQQKDDVQSSHKYTTCVELETNPLVIKQSLDSCDLLSSTDLISGNTDSTLQCVEQKCESSLRPRSIQQNAYHSCQEKHHHIANHRIEISAQSRSSRRTLRCKKKMKTKKEEKKELASSMAQSNQNGLNLRCSQIAIINPLNYQNVQDTCESPLSKFHVPYNLKSPRTVCATKNIHKQLKCVDIQQLRDIPQQKQQILLNFHENSMLDTIYKEDPNSEYITEDNIAEDSSMLRVQPERKSCLKFSRRNVKVDADVTKVNLIMDKNIAEVSNDILVKSSAKWSLQNINAQPSKFIKGGAIVTVEEDTPLKRRKLTSKFSPSLKANTVVCSVNQQKMQKKDFVSTKKGMVCTNRRKNTVGE